MQFLASFLVFGSIWFWIVAVALFVAVMAFDADDRSVSAVLAAMGFFVLLNVSGLLSLGSMSFFSIVSLLFWYVVIGVVWSVFKWYLLLKERHHKYHEVVSKYKETTEHVAEKDYQRELQNYLDQHYRDNRYTRNVVPSASDNKEKIIRWMTIWPWSALWMLINDPFQYLYRALRVQYQRMADSVFSDIDSPP